jgi:hypothetical protein
MTMQVIRRGAETWEVTKVKTVPTVDGNISEYELIGRVVRDGDLYYIGVPDWHVEGFEWDRRPRGYQIPRGAIVALTNGNVTKVPIKTRS